MAKKVKTKSTDIPEPERVLPLDNLIDLTTVRKLVMLFLRIQDVTIIDPIITESGFPRPAGKFKEAALYSEKGVVRYLTERGRE